MGPALKTVVPANIWIAGALLITALCSACSPRETGPDDPTSLSPLRLPPPPIRTDVDTMYSVATMTIVYTDVGFSPERLDIEAGDSVSFINRSDGDFWPASNIHPTHQILPEFDAEKIVPAGSQWTFRFDKPGFWRYHNHLGPGNGGIIVVSGEVAAVEPLNLELRNLDFEEPSPLSIQEYVDLFQNEEILGAFVARHGPAFTVQVMAEGEAYMDVDCHQRAHDVGRLAYGLFGASAFALSSHECQAGAYHGATEALFRQRGTASLKEDIAAICSDTGNIFFRHQCVHGVGHGLMAWTSYELFDTLPLCDQLGDGMDRLSCYSGIFMENVVGGLSGSMGHQTAYLSDDPHFPCNIVEKQYVSACYYYQTSRMLTLFNYDLEQVAQTCNEAPSSSQRDCFLSYGRDVGSMTRGDPERAIEMCAYAQGDGHRTACIEGAVQDRFWDVSGANEALMLCEMLVGAKERGACYWTIINRAKDLYPTTEGMVEFCSRVEPGYRLWCN